MIAKKDLQGGRYYIGRTFQRHMYVGIWDRKEQCFICLKISEWGGPQVYKMNHIEDDDGYTCFEPETLIEQPKVY